MCDIIVTFFQKLLDHTSSKRATNTVASLHSNRQRQVKLSLAESLSIVIEKHF